MDQPIIRIWTLGPFLVERRTPQNTWEKIPSHEWSKGGSTAKNLLKYLVCQQRFARRRDLMEAFWGQRETVNIEDYLNRAAMKVRQVFHSDEQSKLLLTVMDRTAYQLANQSHIWVDADACEHLLAEAKQNGPTTPQGRAFLKQAADLFLRGPFLVETSESWSYGKQGILQTMKYRCLLDLIDAYHHQRQWREAEALAEHLLLDDPLDDQACTRLFTSLQAQGLTREAHRRYHTMKHYYQQANLPFSSLLERWYGQCVTTLEEERQRLLPLPTSGQVMELTQDILKQMRPATLALLFSSKMQESALFLQGETEQSRETRSEPEESNRSIEQETWLAQKKESDAVMNRREMVEYLRLLGIAAATAPQSWFHEPFPLQQANAMTVHKETLHHFETLTDLCLRLSEGSHLDVAERVLWSFLIDVERIAKQPGDVQPFAARVAAQGYLLAASLVGHHNHLLARQLFSERALLYGNISQDPNLQVAALRQLAVSYDYLEKPEKVLQTYQRALSYIDEVDPSLRSCIYAALSGVYAQHQQKQEAYHYIGLAYQHFPERHEQKNEFSFLRLINAHYHTIVLWDGLNHLELGQPHRAVKIFSQLNLPSQTAQIPRIRTELLGYQAQALAEADQMEQAVNALDVALDASLSIKSVRRFRESFKVYQQHIRKKWPSEKRVQALGDRFIEQSTHFL